MIDYESLLATARLQGGGWERQFGELLARRWCSEYRGGTSWEPEVLEIPVGFVTYLFDAAPSLAGADGEDRVVGVWGRSESPERPRDSSRMAGFIPEPKRWSGSGLDRGHFVAHAAGGGSDLNLFPQARSLNRGWTTEGKRWRAFEREAGRSGTFLFVRPTYRDDTWVPAELEAGYVSRDGELSVDVFVNR